MKLASSAAFVALVLASGPGRGQTIEGVAGVPSHGSTLQITGSSFGVKSTAHPISWDDFEGGSDGQNLSTADGWDSVDGWDGSQHSHPPFYSNDVKHSGELGMTCPFVSGTYNSSVLKYADLSTGFYLDAWYRIAPASPASRNYKLFDIFGSGANELPVAAMTGSCHLDESIWIPFYAGPNDGDAEWTGVTFNHLMGQMRHLQVWLQPSTPGVHDGVVWVAVDGTVHADATDKLTVMPGVGHWNQVRIGYYLSHEALNECAASGDAYVFWDDLYIDSSPARVELGDASTYSESAHREIQIPTGWSSTEVTIQFNQGSFVSGETAYLFVVTAQGARSPGHPVTIGEGDTNGPGRPGKPAVQDH